MTDRAEPDWSDDVRRWLAMLPVPAWAAIDREGLLVVGNEAADRLVNGWGGGDGATGWSPAAALREVIETAAPIENLSFDIGLADGRRVSLTGGGVPLRNGRDGRGEVSGALVVLVDATASRRTAGHAAIEIGDERFLAELAHELRGPMNAVLSWMRLFESGMLGPEEQRAGFESVVRSIRAQERTVGDLLEFSRLSQPEATLERAPADLAALAAEAVEEARWLAEQRRIEVRCRQATPQPLMLDGDAARLKHALIDILSYVIRSLPSSGEVELVCSRGDERATVTAGGKGHDAIERLSSKLEREVGQSASSTETSWTPQSLETALAYRVIELHGGEMSARHDAFYGAIVTVHLPVVQRAPAATPPAAPRRSRSAAGFDLGLAGLHVMLVEDHAILRQAMVGILAACGARVSPAASAAEAMECYRRDRPDVLLCDLSMPVEDGYSLLRRIRAEEAAAGMPAVAAIALSAYDDSEHRSHSLATGFHAHLAKPAEPDELVETIRSALAASGASPGQV